MRNISVWQWCRAGWSSQALMVDLSLRTQDILFERLRSRTDGCASSNASE